MTDVEENKDSGDEAMSEEDSSCASLASKSEPFSREKINRDIAYAWRGLGSIVPDDVGLLMYVPDELERFPATGWTGHQRMVLTLILLACPDRRKDDNCSRWLQCFDWRVASSPGSPKPQVRRESSTGKHRHAAMHRVFLREGTTVDSTHAARHGMTVL